MNRFFVPVTTSLVAVMTLLFVSDSAFASEQVPSAQERWSGNGQGRTPDFTRHIVPLFEKSGCNARACHGSFQGQNGFRLSLFGYDPANDHAELFEERDEGGPRVDLKKPSKSFVLLKPTEQEAHEGGKRFEIGSWQYRMFLTWLTAGAKFNPEKDSRLVTIKNGFSAYGGRCRCRAA